MEFIYDYALWGILIVFLIAIVSVIKRCWSGYEADNPVEEAVEEVIKEKTGIDIDLTPGSSEKPKM